LISLIFPLNDPSAQNSQNLRIDRRKAINPITPITPTNPHLSESEFTEFEN